MLRLCLHCVASPLPRLVTAPLALLHRHRRYNNPGSRLMVVHHVNQLGVSRSKQIRLKVCRSVHTYDGICFGLSTYYGRLVDA